MIEVVDATILNTLGRCPRKAQKRFVKHLVPKEQGLAMEFGRACHVGWTEYYRGGKDVEVAIKKAQESYAWKPEDDLRTPEKLAEILRAFARQLGGTEDYTYETGEQQFAVQLTEDMIYAGIVDALMRQGEKLVVHEWKTSTTPWLFCAHPNRQVTGYVFGIRTLGFEISRAVMTVAGVFKTSEEGIMKGKKKADPPHSIFRREIIDLQPWDFDEWMLDTRTAVAELRMYEQQNYWPKRTEACGDYGGCPYMPLCVVPAEVEKLLVESNFVEEPWEPLMERR